jgi:pimeloyl-ACP methyl ester carboxylesterase
MFGALFTMALAVQPSTNATLNAYERPARLVELSKDRVINLDCRGTGSPTIVLEPGWGSWSIDWAPVHDALARVTRTCAYDRAGMGFSSPGKRPTTLATITSDLEALLNTAQIEPPYVLVGGSKAAVFVRAFADAHPRQVAGLVLVDPGSPEVNVVKSDPKIDAQLYKMLADCLARAEADTLDPDRPADGFCIGRGEPKWSVQLQEAYLAIQRRPAYAAARLDELRIPNTDLSAHARRPGALGGLPLRVLTSDQGLSRSIPAERRAALQAGKLAANSGLARLSTRGVHRVVANSGHMVAQDQPQAVIDAIVEVVQEVREQRPRGSGMTD